MSILHTSENTYADNTEIDLRVLLHNRCSRYDHRPNDVLLSAQEQEGHYLLYVRFFAP